MSKVRPLYQIAVDISATWKNVSPHAVKYLEAMYSLTSVTDMYGMDTGETILLYFLSNAEYWRGEDARRIKKELRAILKTAA